MRVKNLFMEKPVIICIGSNRVSGDCLGPLVGDILTSCFNVDAYVYGRSDWTVTALNLNDIYNYISKVHKNSPIIAVDACVGKQSEIGKIKISLGGISAGSALKRNFSKIGDISVLGVVCESASDNLSALMSAPFSLVEKLAERASRHIWELLNCPGFTEFTKQKNDFYFESAIASSDISVALY